MSSFSVWRPDCRLQPSRRERRLRLLLILLTGAAVPASHAPWPWLVAVLALHGVLAFRLWRQPGSAATLTAFRQTPLGWRLHLPNGDTTFAEVHGSVRDWPGLLCLCFRECAEDVAPGCRARCWHLALWSDQLPVQDWRRLRVSLRWRRHDQEGVTTPEPARPDRCREPARCPSSPD